jgi:hypothetical protein
MKLILLSALAFLVAVLARADDIPAAFLRTFPLDERTPYQIPVAVARGLTTLEFPEPPQNYAAARVAFIEAGEKVPDYSADDRIDFVALTHSGSATCSIRAIRPEAQDTLSVFLNGKVYQLFLHGEADKPLLTVEFHFRPTFNGVQSDAISPNRLIDCLTRAKAWPVLAKHYPDQLDGVTRVASDRIIQYPDFRVQISEVFRFEAEDTLVFHLLLENQTDHEIPYQPAELSVRVGSAHGSPADGGIAQANFREAAPIYDASIVDASGLMPARSVTTAWFAITGTRDGGRNNLDPARNIFTVLVPRVAFPSSGAPASTSKPISHLADPKDGPNH